MPALHKYWLSFFLRGIVALIFGFIAVFNPGLGLELLVLIVGIFLMLDGVIALIVGLFGKSLLFLLEGLVGVALGLGIYLYTQQALTVFVVLVSIWAVVTGLLEIITAFEIRRHVANEIWLLLSGLISVIFGFLIFVNPALFAYALGIVIGIYAIIFGVFFVALSFRIKNYRMVKPRQRRR